MAGRSAAIFLVAFAVVAPAPAPADQPRIHIYGPDGCSYFDGLGGDGAAFHALDGQHLLLDHETMQGTQLRCHFDGAFSLIGSEGHVEVLGGQCENNNGGQRSAQFTLTYSDADNAILRISGFEQGIPFLACDWP